MMSDLDNRNPRTIEPMAQQLADFSAQLNALQVKLGAIHALQLDLRQEVQALKAAQQAQTEKINLIRSEVLWGRWWRWLGFSARLLIIAAVIAAVLYFVLDWRALLQWFV